MLINDVNMNSFILTLVLLFLCFQTVESKTVFYVFRQICTPIILTHNSSLPTSPPHPHPKWPVDAEPRGAGRPSLRQGSAHNSKPHREAELIRQKQRNRECININGKVRREPLVSGKASFVRRRSWGVGCGGVDGGGAFRAIASPWQRRGWLTYCQ